jgi:hypothetical protein
MRLLASLIDAAVVILGAAMSLGLGIAGAAAYGRFRGRTDEAEAETDYGEQDDDDQDDEKDYDGSPVHLDGHDDKADRVADEPPAIRRRIDESLRSRPVRIALSSVGAGLAVGGRNWRSPGFRAVGLRRVDAQTGGPICVRSALIGLLFDQARQAATRPLVGSRVNRGLDHTTEGAEVNAFADWGRLLAIPIVSQLVLAIAIRNRRTAYDRVTGTIVVLDR